MSRWLDIGHGQYLSHAKKGLLRGIICGIFLREKAYIPEHSRCPHIPTGIAIALMQWAHLSLLLISCVIPDDILHWFIETSCGWKISCYAYQLSEARRRSFGLKITVLQEQLSSPAISRDLLPMTSKADRKRNQLPVTPTLTSWTRPNFSPRALLNLQS